MGDACSPRSPGSPVSSVRRLCVNCAVASTVFPPTVTDREEPGMTGWGKRAEMHCAKVLDLRKEKGGTPVVKSNGAKMDGEAGKAEAHGAEGVVKVENYTQDDVSGTAEEGPAHKKPRTDEATSMSLEEYEAALDADDTYDNIDLNFPAVSPLSTLTGQDT